MRRFATLSIVILLLLGVISVLWHYAHRFIFYRQTVLEVPVRFEQGFSLNRGFTVDMPANYRVAIQYDEIFRSTVKIPVPQDEFTAESEIRLRDKVIAKGGTTTFPGWTGPWASNRDQVTRYLNSFYAQPGKRYSVFLQITRLLPGLVGKNPKALLVIEPKFTLFYDLRKSLFILASAGIAVIAFVICAYTAWRRRKSICCAARGAT